MTSVDRSSDMSIGEHINELRSRLIKCVIALALFAIIAFILKDDLIDIVFGPTLPDFITNRYFCQLAAIVDIEQLCINQDKVELINTKMAGQFNLHILMSFVAALIFTVPFLLYQLWAFVRPALPEDVKVQCKTLVLQVSLWFFIGLLFGYFIVAPLAVNFLVNYEVSPNIKNMIEVSSYLSSVMGTSLACALVFQLPLLVRLLASMGLITAGFMRKYRRVAFASIIILSAIITPPDVISQLLVAIPLYMLYEYGIVIAKNIESKRQKQERL